VALTEQAWELLATAQDVVEGLRHYDALGAAKEATRLALVELNG
jgi:hypothetical protein